MATTLNSMRLQWIDVTAQQLDVEVTVNDVCRESATFMIQKDYSFLDMQNKVFRGKDSDWASGKGQDKAIKDDNSKDAQAYKNFVNNMGRRYERVECGKDAKTGRKIYKLAVVDGKPVAKKEKDHNFSDALLELAKSHGLTLAMLKADKDCNSNLDLAVRLERLDNQRALQMNFEKIRPELVKLRHEGNALEVDDVLVILNRLFETTNIHINIHGDDEPVTTRASRIVQHTTETTPDEDAMAEFRAFQKFQEMKKAMNG